MMKERFYCYILKCADGKRYYGHTNNLERLIKDHQKRRVRSTQKRGPVELVYFEEFLSRSEAFKKEMQFKNGKTRKETIEKLISNFDQLKCQGFNSRG